MKGINQETSQGFDLLRRLCLMTLVFIVILQIPFWRNSFIECARNFQSYFIPALLFFLVFVVSNLRKFGAARGFVYVLSIALTLMIIYKPFSIYLERSSNLIPESGKERLKVLYANLHEPNTNYKKVLDLVKKERPDVVALLEPNESWLKSLNLKSKYPHAIEKPLNNKFGIALYSKFAFEAKPLVSLGDDLPNVIIVPVLARGKRVLLSLVHAIPPLSLEYYSQDRRLFRRLATYLRNDPGNVVLMGDFNGTVYSYFYKILTDGASLKDAALGRGIGKTWDVNSDFMHLIIDHILYRGDLRLLDYKRGPDIGSDHYPLIALFN